MSDPSITFPNVDPQIAQKLQQASTAIDTAGGKLTTGGSGIGTTSTSVSNAVGAIGSNASGQMVTQLTTNFWPNTSKDGTKAQGAMSDVVLQLYTLQGVINEQLPAIQTGLTAIQTAQADKSSSTKMTQQTADSLQGQINGMVTALSNILSATGPANSGISGVTIGGACATGIQPGAPLPTFNNTTFEGGVNGEQLELFKIDANGKVIDEGDGGDGGGQGGGGGKPPTGGGGGGNGTDGGDGGDGGDDGGDGGNEPGKITKALAKALTKLGGPRFVQLLEKLPPSLQKAIVFALGGGSNTVISLLTTGLSETSLTTFLAAGTGTLTGATFYSAMMAAGISSESAGGVTVLSAIFGGVLVGGVITVVTKLVVQPLLSGGGSHSPAPAPSPTSVPAPTMVTKINTKTGETITTITQPNGSTETIDVKPDGTEVITQTNANGKGQTVQIIPPRK